MAITHDTGITQYLKYGTGATADTYAGRVTGGNLFADPNRAWRPSIGGKHAAARNAPVRLGGTATIEVADATLISYFTRSSWTVPALTSLTFEGALIGDNSGGWTQTGCYINTIEARMSVGEPLVCTIDWVSIDEADQASASPPSQSATHFEWFEGACTFNNTTYDMQSLTIRGNNNLEALTNIETKSANTKLLPQDFKVGKETVEVSVEMLTRPSTSALWNIHEDTDITGVAALVSAASGGHTISFTVANLAGGAHRMPFVADDGTVVFTLDMAAEPNATDSLAISYS